MATDLIAFALATDPDRAAVVADGVTLSYRDVDRRANALCHWLLEMGLSSGMRVALIAKNEVQYLEIQLACLRSGLILVPVNFRLAAAEVAYIVSDCTPAVVIASPELQNLVPNSVETITLDAEYEDKVRQDQEFSPVSLEPSADCTILYTSGTTGRPKGAVLTLANLFARINANLFEYQVKSADVFLQCLPLFHIASNVSYTYAFAGATNVLLRDFHPLAVLELIEKHKVSTALLVPTMINNLLNQPETRQTDLSSLKRLAYGASPIPPSMLAEAISVFGCEFLQLYGMTETSAATVLRAEHHEPDKLPRLLASAGQVALGMETRIVNDDDIEVTDGEVGEITCRGEAVMRGYWSNEAATTQVMKGGWMHTGDMGYRDSEGFFFVTDRKKDMIVSGGENIYPREVEDVLYAHPAVLEAAVIGVPDDKWGERVHAIVVLDSALEPDELIAFTREQIASYKVPKSIEFLSELPKNATGKILKTELREPYWHGKERGVS